MLNIYRNPFLFITPLLIIGVLLSNWMLDDFISLVVIAFSLVSILLLMRFGKAKTILTAIIFGFLFIALGSGLHNQRVKKKSILKNYEGDRISCILQLEEVSKNNKNWKKALGTVKGIIGDSAFIDLNENVLLFVKNEFEEGDILLIHSEFNRIQNSNNPGEFDAEWYWKSKNIQHITFVGDNDYKELEHESLGFFHDKISAIRGTLIQTLERFFSGSSLSVAKALLLGDKSDLSTETRNSFSNSGAMHVLAVSGLHVGIVMFLLLFVLERFSKYISRRAALIITVSFVWFYAAITGFSPSVVRAVLMFSILIIGQVVSKKNMSLNTLFLSAFILLIINPMLIYDIGFQLSYLAMVGILTLYPSISRLILIRNKVLKKLWEGTAIGIAAQICTAPLTLYYFHQFPNYFIITNVGIMALAGVLLSLGIILFLIKGIPFVSNVIALLVGGGIFILLSFVQLIESLPGAVAIGFVLEWWQVVIGYILVISLIVIRNNRIKIYVVLPLLLISIGVIQLDRYQRITNNEMVIFNSKDFSMTIKNKERIICLYQANDERLDKVKYLANNYMQIMPGIIEYIKLKKGVNFLIDNKEIYLKVSSIKNGWQIQINNTTYHAKTGYENFDNEQDNIIEMSYILPNRDNYNLEKGAFILDLN